MGDYYDEDGIHSPSGYGEPERKRRLNPVLVLVISAGLIAVTVLFGGKVLGGDEETAGPPESAPPPTFSEGVTQAQVDRLGASIEARYATGDTEVAQALLSNFMDAHPECVSAVMAGGEGLPREVRAESERVAKYLASTAPHPQAYTTVITVKNGDGTVRAAVLGVSCEEGP